MPLVLGLACDLDGRPLLLRLGEACAAGAQCHSGHCEAHASVRASRLCCAEPCGLGEACSSDGQRCAALSETPPSEPATDLRLDDGEPCRVAAECRSGHCAVAAGGARVCCDRACDGPCELCSAAGACDGYPAIDERCPAPTCPESTTCVSYAPPELPRCAGPGECAGCSREPQPEGRFCGSGEQCDAGGACSFTGAGLVAAGGNHTCAIRSNGDVRCWGRNEQGELGARFDLDAVGDDERPLVVEDLEIDFERTVLQLASGIRHTCALLREPAAPGEPPPASGAVRCWGGTLSSSVAPLAAVMGTPGVALGDHGFVEPELTADVRLPGSAVQLSADPAGAHTCALLESGAVACWGANGSGQLGTGDTASSGDGRSEPLPVVPLPRAALAVAAGGQHTCALLDGGAVRCWGDGGGGRLGYGGEEARLVPGPDVELGGTALAIAAGPGHTCALLEGGGVRCFGDNRAGGLGYGHTTNLGDDPGETPASAARRSTTSPDGAARPLGGDVALGAGSARQIEIGGGATCVRFEGGAVRCWGAGASGGLGYAHDLNIGDELTPREAANRFVSVEGGVVPLGGDLDLGGPALALAAGARCAVLPERKLRCWGDNSHGELGYGRVEMDDSVGLTPAELGDVPYE